MLRAVLCVLALGHSAVAFQAPPGGLATRAAPLHAGRIGSSRTAIGEERDPYGPYSQGNRVASSPYGQGNSGTTPTYGRIQPTRTNSGYSAGPTYPGEPGYERRTTRRQQLQNNQRPPAQYFGGTFAAEAPAAPEALAAPVALPTSEELRIQIDVEKSRGTKDYNQLGQLTNQLQAREALDAKANELQTELQAAEARADYDLCQELQGQLQGLESSISGGTAHATDQGQGASSPSPYYSNDYNSGPDLATGFMSTYDGPMSRRQLLQATHVPCSYSMDNYGGPYVGGYGISARRADIAMRTRGAFHGGGYGGFGYAYGGNRLPLGWGGSMGGSMYHSGYSFGRDIYGNGNVY